MAHAGQAAAGRVEPVHQPAADRPVTSVKTISPVAHEAGRVAVDRPATASVVGVPQV